MDPPRARCRVADYLPNIFNQMQVGGAEASSKRPVSPPQLLRMNIIQCPRLTHLNRNMQFRQARESINPIVDN